ncbi:hypothetical protein Bca101_010126 [Brassica carinata]
MDFHLGSSSDGVGTKPFNWKYSHVKDYPITEDPYSVAHLIGTSHWSGDLQLPSYESKYAICDSYLDVLVSVKEKWERKKVATDCEARLWEVMTNIDLFKEIMNNKLLASEELSRCHPKEIELGAELDIVVLFDLSV